MDLSLVVVITGASRRVGFGHLRRCLTLCEALKRRGTDSFFVLSEADSGAMAWMKQRGLPHCRAPLSNPAAIAALCKKRDASVAIVDTYDSSASLLNRLLASGLPVLVIDDLANRRLPSTWLTNSAIPRGPGAYRRLTKGKLLLGPRYALLRREFAGVARATAAKSAKKVLIAIGGSDPRGLTPALLEALAGTGEKLHIRAVMGPLSKSDLGFKSLGNCRTEILRDVRSMVRLMRWADVAVAGGGQTLFELAAAGCPCVAMRIAPNQDVTTRLFSRIGSVIMAANASHAAEHVRALLADPARRAAMGRRGRRAVDGLGAERVADVLAKASR
jgi:UDP-2,4-diacetamido-2,4,6-trideoxy-beta-L-altropyranose hydrolase